jgi:hypothetical protein
MDKIKAANILKKHDLKSAVKYLLNNWFLTNKGLTAVQMFDVNPKMKPFE